MPVTPVLWGWGVETWEFLGLIAQPVWLKMEASDSLRDCLKEIWELREDDIWHLCTGWIYLHTQVNTHTTRKEEKKKKKRWQDPKVKDLRQGNTTAHRTKRWRGRVHCFKGHNHGININSSPIMRGCFRHGNHIAQIGCLFSCCLDLCQGTRKKYSEALDSHWRLEDHHWSSVILV